MDADKELEELGRKISISYIDGKSIREVLANAEYRKANEVRIETAKEILQELSSWYSDKLDKEEVLEFLREEYGVEEEP